MLKSLLSLFLQSNCPLCERSSQDLICQYCQGQIKSCQVKNPCQLWQGDIPLFVWGIYGGKLKQAIATLKYDNHPELGELMGTWLGKAWLNSHLHTKTQKLTVVPIPLHPKKLRERGFNQAELIAKSFCQLTGYMLESKGLLRVRETQAMFGLTPQERVKNLSDAFSLGVTFPNNLTKSPVLLMDDIYTTGTTVREATKILQASKIQVVGVAAIASSKIVAGV